MLAGTLVVTAVAGCDITEPSEAEQLRERSEMARQIMDRFSTVTDGSGLRVVFLEGSPFGAVQRYFSPSLDEIYERLEASEPFASGYVEVLGELGLDEQEILGVLTEERRTDELGSTALAATGHPVVELEDPLFFDQWSSVLAANDSWATAEEELGYRFVGLQIGAPVDDVLPGLTLVPFTLLCGQGCGSGHIAVFVHPPVGSPVLVDAPLAWVGYRS